jgi:hypothetical protein
MFMERAMARKISVPSRANAPVSLAALAAGAVAFGALAIGAVAIARLAVGRVTIKKARIDALDGGELTVRRLRVVEQDDSGA